MPYISIEALVGAGLILLLAFGYQYSTPSTSQGGAAASAKKNKKKNKKKGGKAGAGHDALASVTASEVDAQRSAQTAKKATAKKSAAPVEPASVPAPAPVPATPSPPSDSTKPEPPSFAAAAGGSSQPAKPKTLAEKLVPKQRKTKVDDMLAPEDRAPQLARVMKITPEHDPSAKLPRFEDDYVEDFSDSGASTPARQDDGWNVVAAKKKPVSLSIGGPSGAIASNPHSKDGLTKIQRKNAKKSEMKKAQREAEEADRQRRLASHKRDLERNKINEIYNNQQKKTIRQGGKVVSAGQGATLNEKGQLVWD